MTRYSWILSVLLLITGSAGAIGKADVRTIIKNTYPGAKITEIEKERYKGKKVYEVDFRHDGQNMEAIISLDGEIVKVGIDD